MVTCPQHAASYMDRSQPGGSDAARNAEQAYNRGSDMGDYEDQDLPNGDMPRHRALDRSGGNSNLLGPSMVCKFSQEYAPTYPM